MAAKAPSGPRVTSRKSASRPTQASTMSAPLAAAAGVGAVAPPYSAAHFSARAGLRLNTVTSWPALLRCPAMGKPITPNPRNASFISVIHHFDFGRRYTGKTGPLHHPDHEEDRQADVK